MTRSVLIDGVERADITRVESLRITNSAGGDGEAGLGELTLDDVAGTLIDDANRPDIRKTWKVIEDATASPTVLGFGRIGNYETARHSPNDYLNRQVDWKLYLEDANIELRGFDVHGQVRPSETDYARVQWVASTFLNGSPRASTNLDFTTYVPNTNTVTMEAKTYNNADVLDVLQDCMEQADKICFVTSDGELFYDQKDSTAYTSSISISDRIGDVNQTTVFEPIWDQGPALNWEGQTYASRLRMGYGSELSVLVGPDAGEADHDYWVGRTFSSDALSAGQAASIAAGELAFRAKGVRTYSLTLLLANDQVDLVKVGQRIQIKARAAVDVDDAYAYRRIAQLQWEVESPEYYWAHLQLDQPLTAHSRFSRGSPSGSVTVCHGTISDCVDPFTRGTSGDWGTSPILCLEWSSSSNGTHYTNGTAGVLDASLSATDDRPSDWLTVTQWTGTDLEFLALVKMPAFGEFKDPGGPRFVFGQTDGSDANGPTFPDNPGFRFDCLIDVDGDLNLGCFADGGGATIDVAPGVFAVTDAANQWVWVRCRLEDEWMRMKAWLDGTSEPGSYQLEETPAGPPGVAEFLNDVDGLGATDTFEITCTVNDGGVIELSSLEFVSGLDCEGGYCDVCGLTGGPARVPGTSNDAAPIDHDHDSVDNGDAAGGDLSGTYPNPTVSKIEGIDISSTPPTTGQVLTAISTSAAAWDDPGSGSGPFEFTGSDARFVTGGSYLLSNDEDVSLRLGGLDAVELNNGASNQISLENGKTYFTNEFGIVLPIVSEPAGGDSETGQVIYDFDKDKFRAYENGAWVDMIGGGGMGAGSSFPGSPATNDRYFRTDLLMEFVYDGTRWLSSTPHTWQLGLSDALFPDSVTTTNQRTATPPLMGGTDIWLVGWTCSYFVASGGTALDGSNKWVGTWSAARDASVTTDAVATMTIASGASNQWLGLSGSLGSLLDNGTVHREFVVTWTKTGTPGTLRAFPVLTYRVVAT